MSLFHELIAPLPSSHQHALQWFRDREGREVDWPKPLPDGLHLVTAAKGIHKPKGWRHALTVRQTIGSSYADLDPEVNCDGSWKYRYFQEGKNPDHRDRYFTNRSLIACMEDAVPIGVLKQTRSSPNPRYKVLGVALVHGWDSGYFLLRGLSSSHTEPDALSRPEAIEEAQPDPRNLEDARRRTQALIVLRQGQSLFRARILEAYEGRCAITECNVIEALEAAHIVPYRGEHTNLPSNGLLLRADLHTLFDLGLIAIDTVNYSVIFSPRLRGTTYEEAGSMMVRLPKNVKARPSVGALDEHRRWAASQW